MEDSSKAGPDAVARSAILIGKSRSTVFGAFDDDENFFTLRPDIVEHRDIEALPTGGHACTQVHVAGRRRVVARCVNVEYQPDQRTVDVAESEDGTRVRVTVELSDADGGSRVTVETKIFFAKRRGWLFRRVARAQVQRSTDAVLTRLKKLVED